MLVVLLSLVAVLACRDSLATASATYATSTSAPSSLHMGRSQQYELMLRRALGIDPFLPGSLGDVIDFSLFPRPQRLARLHPRTKKGRSGSARYVPASAAASRHHVRTPSNVLAIEHTSGTFLMVASFQTDFVFKFNLGEGLGHPEVFASHVSCDLDQLSACSELSGPWGLSFSPNSAEVFVASFGTDRILILDFVSSKILGEMGNSEELNGPEDLAMGPRGQFLFVSSHLGGEIVRYNVQTRMRDRVFAGGLRGPEGLALMGSRILVAACNTDHSVRFLDLHDGSEIAAFVGSNATLQYPIYTRSLSGGSGRDGDNTTREELLYNATILEKPVDVVWTGGNRVLVSMAGAIGSFLLDQDHRRVHFEGFAQLGGKEKLKTKHPSGMSILRISTGQGWDASTLFVAGYDTQGVLVFQIVGEGVSSDGSGTALELDFVTTGRL